MNQRADGPKKWILHPDQRPWYDKPNALDILAERRREENLTDADHDLLRLWATDGYCVVSGIVPEVVIDSMVEDLENLWTAEQPFDMYGSGQEAHQDTAVFHVFPPNYIIGAWLACEDISPDSGPPTKTGSWRTRTTWRR